MLKIGLTGGIGSGKTTIAKIFSTLGVPVYESDAAAKRLMQYNAEIKNQLLKQFGSEVFQQDQLNRSFLANVVFNDATQLERLNAIIHPVTIRDSIAWFENQKSAYAIKEAAIIFETGSEQYLDYVIGVWAPEDLRIQRTMQRSQLTEAQVRKRMRRQMDETQKMERCDFIIDNDGTKPVIPQVLAVHEQLNAEAAKLQ